MRIMLANRTVHRLGAEELIELGRPVPLHALARHPFFLGRAPRIGDTGLGQLEVLGMIGGWLADGLSFVLTQLGNLLDVPLKIISQGIDLVFNGVADLLRNIPFVGDLLAEILVLGGAVIKFGLSIPGMLLREAGNVFGGIAKALKSENSDSKNQEKVNDAKDRITEKAPLDIKDTVKGLLNASGVTGKNLTPSVSPSGEVSAPTGPITSLPQAEPEMGLGTVLAIGVPVVGAVVLVAALL